MESLAKLAAALANADPVVVIVVLVIAFLLVFHSLALRTLELIERLARKRGDR
jgi:hypothetical protein